MRLNEQEVKLLLRIREWDACPISNPTRFFSEEELSNPPQQELDKLVVENIIYPHDMYWYMLAPLGADIMHIIRFIENRIMENGTC